MNQKNILLYNILYQKDIHDPIGNSKQPDSPINTRRSH